MDWLWQLDQTVFRAVHVQMRRDWLDPFFLVITQTGLGHVQFSALAVSCLPQKKRWIVPGGVAAFLLLALVDERWRDSFEYQLIANGMGLALLTMSLLSLAPFEPRRVALPALGSGILAGAAHLLIRGFVDRIRPSQMFGGPLEHVYASTSFPSGHSTTSFAIAISLTISTRRTDAAWVGWLAVSWATLVGLSRIYVGVHWPTDVLGGFALGAAAAAMVHLAIGRGRDVGQDVAVG